MREGCVIVQLQRPIKYLNFMAGAWAKPLKNISNWGQLQAFHRSPTRCTMHILSTLLHASHSTYIDVLARAPSSRHCKAVVCISTFVPKTNPTVFPVSSIIRKLLLYRKLHVSHAAQLWPRSGVQPYCIYHFTLIARFTAHSWKVHSVERNS